MRLHLPRAMSSHGGAKRSRSQRAMPRGRGERILVVEDNAPMRAIVMQLLSGLGYRPMEAGTAADALAILNAGEAVDLVFSDVIMPGSMTGFDLADVVAAHYPSIPVLLSSGFADRAGSLQGKRVGRLVDPPVLSKPYRREELAHAMRKVLDGR